MFLHLQYSVKSNFCYRYLWFLRSATVRSQNVVSHVEAITKYNDRLEKILDNEKAKDETTRQLEKQLFNDKLRVRSFFLASSPHRC